MKFRRYLLSLLVMVAIPCAKAQPVITQQPTNQTVLVGGNATFGVSVSGTGPFTYHWFQITGGMTNLLTGQTNATLILSGVSLAFNGNVFFFLVSDTYGNSATSALVTLTVTPAIYSFGAVTNAAGNPLDGANPYGTLLLARDSYLYGTTAAGGGNGLASPKTSELRS